MKSKFSKEEEEYIKCTYPQWGANIIADKLKLPIKKILNKAQNMKLKRLNRNIYLPDNKCNVGYSQFLNIESPYVAYFLGLLWSDGYVSKNDNSVSLSMNSEDMKEIYENIKFLGNFTFKSRIREGRAREVSEIYKHKYKLLKHSAQ